MIDLAIYIMIAWASAYFINFTAIKIWSRNGYTSSSTDRSYSIFCGIVWPVALPVIVVVAIGTIIVNFFSKD